MSWVQVPPDPPNNEALLGLFYLLDPIPLMPHNLTTVMGRYWSKLRAALGFKNNGFTIVEVLIIAPITILSIGALILMIVSLTGNVLKTRGANTMSYQVQDALNVIEQDIKLSGAFLSIPNVNPIVSPQGFDNGTASFANVGTNGNMLILNAYATKQNPNNDPASLIFNRNQPNACGDSESSNLPLMVNIIYFVKDGSLWRRTLMPQAYLTMGCDVPWQKPSCSPGVTGSMCQLRDTKLVDGLSDPNNDFVIQYYESTDSITPLSSAVNSAVASGDRQQVMRQAGVARVSIHAKQIIAGVEVARSGEIIGESKNNNAVGSLNYTAPRITAQPTDRNVPKGTNATFTSTATGTDVSVKWEMSTNRGQSWSTVSGATSTNLTVSNVQPSFDGRWYRAVFSNDFATIPSEPAALYFYDTSWNTLPLQNSWTHYGSPYSTPKYRKTSDGVVVVQGMLKRSSAAGAGSTIANLPIGYRPSTGNLIFINSTNSNTYARTDIFTDGNIVFQGGSNGWYSLDNIMFLPSNGRYDRTEVTEWSNGWNDYSVVHGGTSFDPVTYTVDNSGRVHLNGLAGGTVFSSGAYVFSMPNELASSTYLFNIGRSGSGWAGYGISGRTVGLRGSGASWVSFQNMYYPESFTGWTNLGGGSWVYHGSYSTPRYTKSSDGIVTLTGIVNGGSYTYDGGIIGVLPVNFRPASRLLIHAYSNEKFIRLDIDALGNIRYTGPDSSGWVSLDGISFYAN
jgi:Tfp pilus assembly protein PilE